MTGAYLRVKRNDKFTNVEVEHLSNEEREKLLENDPRLMQWLHLVCNTLSQIEPLLVQLEDEGIIERR